MTLNGYDRPTPTVGYGFADQPPRSRREERRADRMADADRRREDRRTERDEDRKDRREDAEQRRRDAQAAAERRTAEREAREKAKTRRRKERRTARRERITTAKAAITAHMPLAGIPVVAVSLVMGWTGQAEAALALGMGIAAFGVPVLSEGMTLTLAGLTAAAIERQRPHRFLLTATWITGTAASLANAAGHLLAAQEKAARATSNPAAAIPAEGWYQAGAYAVASLAALVLWGLVMRSKKSAVAGKTAEELARWRRVRRRHPLIASRARQLADLTGQPFPEAFARAWERTHGAAPGEPTIGEIRTGRRAGYQRAVAQAWDGRKKGEQSAPTTPTAPAAQPDEPAAEAATVPDSAPQESAPRTVPGLWLAEGTSVNRASTRLPLTLPARAADAVPQALEMPFPQEKDAPRADGSGEPSGLSQRQLKKAAKAWHERYAKIGKDRRYKSPTGHLGVSPYAVASALEMRAEKGPQIVAELIDAQLIPAGEPVAS